MTLLLLLLTCLPQDARQEYLQRENAAFRHFWEERLRLAEWCIRSDLSQDARDLLQFMVRHIPGNDPYKKRASRLLQGKWVKRSNAPIPGLRSEFFRRLEKYYRTCADLHFKAGESARSAKREEDSRRAQDLSLLAYFDHTETRALRREAKLEGFGWMPQAECERLRGNVISVDDPKLESHFAHDADHSDWSNSWILSSAHYRIRSDLPLRDVHRAISAAEALYSALCAFDPPNLKPPPGPLCVQYFRRDSDLQEVRQSLPGTRIQSSSFFHALTGNVYLSASDPDRGFNSLDEQLLLHEITHQWIERSAGQPVWSAYQDASRANAADSYWIVEGFATYCALYDPSTRAFRSDPFRKRVLREALEKSTLPDLPSLLAMGYSAFLQNPALHYPLAGELTQFLVEGEGGRYASAYRRLLREFYEGTAGCADWGTIFEVAPAEIDVQFRKSLAP